MGLDLVAILGEVISHFAFASRLKLGDCLRSGQFRKHGNLHRTFVKKEQSCLSRLV